MKLNVFFLLTGVSTLEVLVKIMFLFSLEAAVPTGCAGDAA
jgi:hypothetical protein